MSYFVNLQVIFPNVDLGIIASCNNKKAGDILSKRIEELDSIRGLAALTVVFHHMWMVNPILPIIFSLSPVRIAIYGHAAVILFFLLKRICIIATNFITEERVVLWILN
ncbi:hypothetical protein ACWCQ1_52145 [Streptomyces sp. NPDC002144]